MQNKSFHKTFLTIQSYSLLYFSWKLAKNYTQNDSAIQIRLTDRYYSFHAFLEYILEINYRENDIAHFKYFLIATYQYYGDILSPK